jgi:hypothetical protein
MLADHGAVVEAVKRSHFEACLPIGKRQVTGEGSRSQAAALMIASAKKSAAYDLIR